MSNELPHAALRCTSCATSFSVKLKKGRIPTKPIPCPRCRTPITVTEADIVDPGARTAGVATSVPSILQKTKLVAVDEAELLAAAAAAATATETPRPPPLVDPPTAEVIDEPEPEPEPPHRAPPQSQTGGFGIIQRRRSGEAKAPRNTADDLSLTVGAPGVHVVRGEGRGKRDNVYGERTASSVAIGRIATKKVAASEAGRRVMVDDPDLPALATDLPARLNPPVAAPPDPEPASPVAEPSEGRLELELSEVSEGLPELEPEPVASEGSEDWMLPVSEASEGLPELEPEPLRSEGSEGLLELEPVPLSEGSEGLMELEPEPIDDLPAPKADLPAVKADLPAARAGIPAPSRPGIPGIPSPRLDLSRLRDAAAAKAATRPEPAPRNQPHAQVQSGTGRARLPSLFDLELPLDQIANEASDAIQAGLDRHSSSAALDISFDPVVDGAAAPADRHALVADLALEMEDERARDASLITAPQQSEDTRAPVELEPYDDTLLVDAEAVAKSDNAARLHEVNLPWRSAEPELPDRLPLVHDFAPFGDSPDALRTNLADDATRMTASDEFPVPAPAKKSAAPIVIVVVVLLVVAAVVAFALM